MYRKVVEIFENKFIISRTSANRFNGVDKGVGRKCGYSIFEFMGHTLKINWINVDEQEIGKTVEMCTENVNITF